jgi:hypothetical protein
MNGKVIRLTPRDQRGGWKHSQPRTPEHKAEQSLRERFRRWAAQYWPEAKR